MAGLLDFLANPSQYLPGILNGAPSADQPVNEAAINVPSDDPYAAYDVARQEAASREAARKAGLGVFDTGAAPVPAAGISGQQAMNVGAFGALAPVVGGPAALAPDAPAPDQPAAPLPASSVPLPRPRPLAAPQLSAPATVDNTTLPPNATPTVGQGAPPASGAAAPPVPPSSLLGRIGQVMIDANNQISPHTATLLALAGGLAGAPSWGTGISRGLTAAAAALPQDQRMMIQSMGIQSAYKALRAADVPPDLALASVYNPTIMQSTLQNYVTDRQWKTITVNDGFGGQRVLAFNPFTQETKDVTATGSATPAASSPNGSAAPGAPNAAPLSIQQVMGNIAQKRAAGASVQDLLQQVPAVQRDYVGALLSGNALPSNMGRAVDRAAVIKLAHAVDPTFDETMIPTRVKVRQDFSGEGKNGQAIGSFNTVQHHIGKLSDDLENLAQYNGNYPALNSVRGWLANNANTNPQMRDSMQAVNDDVKAVTDEMSNAYKAGHVSDTEIAQWNKLASSNLPPQQMRRAIADFVDLLNGKRDSLNNIYRQTFHTDAAAIDQGANDAITQKVHERLVNGGQPTAAQSQAPIAVATKADYDRLPRGATYTAPDGSVRTKQ